MATYYALSKTLWQGDTFKPVAGPFASKAEAVKFAEERENEGINDYGRRISVVETIVASKTEMRRTWGFSEERALKYICT